MKFVSTPDCAPPAGHYSQGVVHGGLVWVSGMLAVDPKTGERRLGAVEEQTRQALENVDAVLRAAGSSRDRVLKCTCYISDIELWGRVNAVYAEFFGNHKPARAVVPTRDLHYGFLVEIECVAAVGDGEGRCVTRFVCRDCGLDFDVMAPRWRCDCGGLLDLEFTPSLDPAEVAGRPATLWRYREALPVPGGAELTLGEGFTPMVEVELGGRTVLVKQEQLFPTGSYKDRGAAVMMAMAAHMGVTDVVEDSSGNAGCAVSAFAAKAGIRCRIFVPADNSPGKLGQIELYGAELNPVPGSREDTAAACMAAAGDHYYASHVYNPFFFHGTKTFAYEVVEQLGWRAPDTVVLPAGNGTLLLGAHIGFTELKDMGFIGRVPRLVAVQSARCAPLCAAFAAGADGVDAVSSESTLAEGIAIALPMRGEQMLAAVRDTGGTCLAVSEEAILAAFRDMGRKGFCIEPTSAAVAAGAAEYARRAAPGETVVTMFTGHGLKVGDKLHKLVSD